MKKILAVILAVMIFFSSLPINTFAVEGRSGSHAHPVCSKYSCYCDEKHAVIEWEPFPDDYNILSSGYYYLESDIDLSFSSIITVKGDVEICLNGYEICNHEQRCAIDVSSGSLSITDCGTTGMISSKPDVQDSFSGMGAVSVNNDADFFLYDGFIVSESAGAGLGLNTTGDVYILGGSISSVREGIDIYKINDLFISGGMIKSENNAALVTEYYAEFHNIIMTDGYLEGNTCGMLFDRFECSGEISISGGTLYGKGPVPNITTSVGHYYGLSFLNSYGGYCNVEISGGALMGVRGGLYNNNPLVDITVSGGIIGGISSINSGDIEPDGINASCGNIVINGGKIYGILNFNSANIIINDGEVFWVNVYGFQGAGSLTVLGGTVGRVGNYLSEKAILAPGELSSVKIYDGNIEASRFAVYSLSAAEVLIAGGNLSGGESDIYSASAASDASKAYLSLDSYDGKPLTVTIGPDVEVGSYIAKDVAHEDLINLDDDAYYGLYEYKNTAVKIVSTPHEHSFVQHKIVAPTCTSQGYTYYKCNCGDYRNADFVDMLEHTYVEHVCTVCGYSDLVASGMCGSNLTWILDKEGALTISGSGDMANFPLPPEAPWYVSYQNNIKRIKFDGEITSVGNYAFVSLSNHQNSILIPKSITSFGVYSFSGCNISNIYYTGTQEEWNNINIGSNNYEINNATIHFNACPVNENYAHSYESVVTNPTCISQGYTTYTCVCGDSYVDDYVDATGHSYMQEITITATCTDNGEKTFTCYDCEDTYTEEIPATGHSSSDGYLCDICGETVGTNPILGYLSYEIINGEVTITGCDQSISGDIVIPSMIDGYPVKKIGASAFSSCKGITGVKISYGIEIIGAHAFSFNHSLNIVEFPESLKEIDISAFYECTALESIVIPDSVITIDMHAFKFCTNLKDIKLSENLQYIGTDIFYDTAFYNDSANWENDVLYIDKYLINAKEDISGFYEVKAGTEIIADQAFLWCVDLEYVKFPDSLKRILDFAFLYCQGLKNIEIPASVEYINHAFSSCTSLESITVDENNEYFCNDEFGVLFNKEKTELIQYPVGNMRNEYIIPDSVDTVKLFSFSRNRYIQNIIIPEGVITIEQYAFYDCPEMKEVLIPASVEHIGYYAFGWYEPGFENDQKLDGFVIYGYSGSYAQYFANENEITFVAVDSETPQEHEHDYVTVITAPTCTEIGYTTYICECGDSYISDETPALGHLISEGVCQRCGKTFDSAVIIGNAKGHPGDTVDVYLSLNKETDIKSMAIHDIVYDSDKLTLVDGEWLAEGAVIADWNQTDEAGVITFTQNKTLSGNLFRMTFEIREELEDSASEINCTFRITSQNGDDNEETIDIDIIPGFITIVNIIKGDVNDDESVDSNDAIQLLYHILIPDRYSINQNGDFNGNGKVNSNDAIHLLYHTLIPERYPLS